MKKYHKNVNSFTEYPSIVLIYTRCNIFR